MGIKLYFAHTRDYSPKSKNELESLGLLATCNYESDYALISDTICISLLLNKKLQIKNIDSVSRV